MKLLKILFVCTGNTCRSPMAEYILRWKLKLADVKGVRVSSAGLHADDGAKMSKNSFIALKRLGIKGYGFKSKCLSIDMMKNYTAIICMTDAHKRYLNGFKNVYTIDELTGVGEIIDPFGGDINLYVNTAYQLDDACNILLEKILTIKGENNK